MKFKININIAPSHKQSIINCCMILDPLGIVCHKKQTIEPIIYFDKPTY